MTQTLLHSNMFDAGDLRALVMSSGMLRRDICCRFIIINITGTDFR